MDCNDKCSAAETHCLSSLYCLELMFFWVEMGTALDPLRCGNRTVARFNVVPHFTRLVGIPFYVR